MRRLYESSTSDTTRLFLETKIAYEYSYIDPDTAVILSNKSLIACQKENYIMGILESYFALSIAYSTMGEYDSAILYAEKGLEWQPKSEDRSMEASLLNSVGIGYYYKGEYDKALIYYEKVYEIDKEDESKTVAALVNIGSIHSLNQNFETAINYYKKAVALHEKYRHPDDELSYVIALSNLGTDYALTQRDSLATFYTQKSLVLSQEMEDWGGVAYCYATLAKIAENQKDWKKAVEEAEKSISFYQSINDVPSTIEPLLTLAVAYSNQNLHQKAENAAQKALEIANTTQSLASLSSSHLALHQVFKKQKNFEKALFHHEKYKELEDSTFNLKKSKIINSLENKVALDLKNAEIEQERTAKEFQEKINYLIVASLVVVLIFMFIVWRNRIKIKQAYQNLKAANEENLLKSEEIRQQKEEILQTLETVNEQKELIASKNLHIIASINYAKRIQNALLPKVETLDLHLPAHWILYLPKDIVSGDFYWLAQMNESSQDLLLAIADCTGHGVPGALMTVVGHNLLDQIVNQDKIEAPAQILHSLDEKLQRLLQQQVENKELSQEFRNANSLQDGMDIVLLRWNGTKRSLTFAAAKRPLWIWHKATNELRVLKGSQYPIGSTQYKQKTFGEHHLTLEKGDRVYAFTDGYADQFGKEGKMTIKKMRDFLNQTHHLPLQTQKEAFAQFFAEWKEDTEQTDDVLFFAMEVGK
ncbi:PP2C family protein-serine/threonine phosphatase [Hugenholtzia roseola]|uniref:PP2C family protein-serine/threonine phosphatase n=1 Tax=Hugenholtzia roseola TaxID=1002 RepID=UPI001377984E|nr:PP2C family protein-serine/threonine phosphatase [Hugenholtzia roseola]